MNKYDKTAKQTVINAINLNHGIKPINIRAGIDERDSKKNIIKIDFINNNDAKAFASKYKDVIIGGIDHNIVILGEGKATYIFNQLGIGSFGKTHPRPMFAVLIYELKTSSMQPIPQNNSSPCNILVRNSNKFNDYTISNKQLIYFSDANTPNSIPYVQGAICFYESNRAYYEFTNYYPAPINVNGIVYPTSEHYFQAEKFASPLDKNAIINNSSPDAARKYAETHKGSVRNDWHTGNSPFKITAMKNALWTKFTQHQKLGNLLLSTAT